MKTTLNALRDTYKQCKSDDDMIEHNGSLFYGAYLRYLIQYFEICKVTDDEVIELKPTMHHEEVADGCNEEETGAPTIPEEGKSKAG